MSNTTAEKQSGTTPWSCPSYLALNAIYKMLPDDDQHRLIEMPNNSLRELFKLLGQAVYEDLEMALGNK
jgi:hypothetical protein